MPRAQVARFGAARPAQRRLALPAPLTARPLLRRSAHAWRHLSPLDLPPSPSCPVPLAPQMEVGIEDCLHIEFEYDRGAYHLTDTVLGRIHFLLVRDGGEGEGPCCALLVLLATRVVCNHQPSTPPYPRSRDYVCRAAPSPSCKGVGKAPCPLSLPRCPLRCIAQQHTQLSSLACLPWPATAPPHPPPTPTPPDPPNTHTHTQVRIKLKHMELEIRRRETSGAGAAAKSESGEPRGGPLPSAWAAVAGAQAAHSWAWPGERVGWASHRPAGAVGGTRCGMLAQLSGPHGFIRRRPCPTPQLSNPHTHTPHTPFLHAETVAKFEIMDGAPVRGESIPIRRGAGGTRAALLERRRRRQ